MADESKNITPVASGMVKKTSGFSKFISDFFAADAQTIGNHLVTDVLKPAALRLIDEVVTTAKDVALYGENAPPTQKKPGVMATKISYDKASEKRVAPSVDTKKFDYPVVSSKKDADVVIKQMSNILEQYDVVTVADLYELCDINDFPYTANSYGWDNLGDLIVVHTADGWLIKPPNPQPISNL